MNPTTPAETVIDLTPIIQSVSGALHLSSLVLGFLGMLLLFFAFVVRQRQMIFLGASMVLTSVAGLVISAVTTVDVRATPAAPSVPDAALVTPSSGGDSSLLLLTALLIMTVAGAAVLVMWKRRQLTAALALYSSAAEEGAESEKRQADDFSGHGALLLSKTADL